VDETLELLEPETRGDLTIVERRSTVWERAWLELHRAGPRLEVHTCVEGRGALTDVRLLGGRSAIAGAPLGRTLSGTSLPTLPSPPSANGRSGGGGRSSAAGARSVTSRTAPAGSRAILRRRSTTTNSSRGCTSTRSTRRPSCSMTSGSRPTGATSPTRRSG